MVCALTVAESGVEGLAVGSLTSIAFMTIPVARAAHWYLSIQSPRVAHPGRASSGRELTRLGLDPVEEVGSVSLYTGDRWPEWNRWATFAAITVTKRDRWEPEFECPHLFAMSDNDTESWNKFSRMRVRSAPFRIDVGLSPDV
ncbi:hypothetical protein GCM10022234_21150 [Aeromicrobium panaciterrae]